MRTLAGTRPKNIVMKMYLETKQPDEQGADFPFVTGAQPNLAEEPNEGGVLCFCGWPA